jgi:hypothetical protein
MSRFETLTRAIEQQFLSVEFGDGHAGALWWSTILVWSFDAVAVAQFQSAAHTVEENRNTTPMQKLDYRTYVRYIWR